MGLLISRIFAFAVPAVPAVPATAPATTQNARADLDREVLDAVFVDLLTLQDDKSPVAMRGKPPESIRVAEEPATWKITVEQVLQQHDKKLWQALSPAEMDAAREAAKDLVRRHDEHDVSGPIISRDPRVQRVSATTKPAAPSTQPLAEVYNRPIRAWSPGYTADRGFAVVQLSIPWSMHHADGTYLLKWDEKAHRWVVVLRQFIFYV
jgi:hypothetical protein